MYYNSYRPDKPIPADSYRVENTPRPPKRNKRFWPKAVALCLACLLLGGGAGFGGAYLYQSRFAPDNNSTAAVYENLEREYDHSSEDSRGPAVINVSHTSTGEQLTLEEIYAAWVNSTVGITTQVTTNIYGQQVSSAAAGSGFVFSSDGYILTNYHVIKGATSIKVTFYDGTEYDARLIGGEETNDVAVLKIDASGLTPVVIGNSDNLRVGETVTTIGNPLGELTFTQTAGIVSALGRMITMSDGTKMNMIQTDCTINSGNSGGPLFNSSGEVIGITSAKYSNNGDSSASIEGIGFAIPINDVFSMVTDIMEHGYVTGKPYMGISVVPVSEYDAQRYNLAVGIYVNSVEANGAAAAAGLQQGDVITAMDGVTLTDVSDLTFEKNKHKAGDSVELSVYRMGQEISLTLTFGEEAPSAEAPAQEEEEQSQQLPQQQAPNYYPFWPFSGFGW